MRLGRVGFGWLELGWFGLGWIGLGWVGLCLVELSWFIQFSLYTVKMTHRLVKKAWLILSVLCLVLPCFFCFYLNNAFGFGFSFVFKNQKRKL